MRLKIWCGGGHEAITSKQNIPIRVWMCSAIWLQCPFDYTICRVCVCVSSNIFALKGYWVKLICDQNRSRNVFGEINDNITVRFATHRRSTVNNKSKFPSKRNPFLCLVCYSKLTFQLMVLLKEWYWDVKQGKYWVNVLSQSSTQILIICLAAIRKS